MKRLALAALTVCGLAHGDGLPLDHGRYAGRVAVLSLSAQQKRDIAHFHACHVARFRTMNIYTPYVFTMNAAQARQLQRAKGFSPRRFQVLETMRGENDAGPLWNVALRYSEDRIEIPLDLLVPDAEAARAVAEQGWKVPNPCFPSR